MTYFDLIEDSSGNFEVHENDEYNDCYSNLEEAGDYVSRVADEGDYVNIIYHCINTQNESATIDDLGTWCYN